MSENPDPQTDGVAEAGATETEADRVPFTVELVELDSNPIVLQPKSY
ncbi:hypothetical protein [Kitasatospora sp. NBC_01266]|jgi:hypothetical protein|nr:hypothetical protein [Kitasatospora sp. NBC_01266]